MNISELIKDVEEFARLTGKTPEYVCREATNNARLYQRLQNRKEQLERDETRIRDFMASYGSDCSAELRGNASATRQPTIGGK